MFIETNRVYYKENSEITSLLLFRVFLKVRQGFPGLSSNLGRVLSFFRVEALSVADIDDMSTWQYPWPPSVDG